MLNNFLMRPLAVLLLFFVLQKAEGIRLEKDFLRDGHQEVHEEKSYLVERSNGGVGDVILCREGHCTGVSRKLIVTVTTSTPATTTSNSKNENANGENKANSKLKGSASSNEEMGREHKKLTANSSKTSQHQETTHNSYMDLVDIAEMDYSAARRKPPIHN